MMLCRVLGLHNETSRVIEGILKDPWTKIMLWKAKKGQRIGKYITVRSETNMETTVSFVTQIQPRNMSVSHSSFEEEEARCCSFERLPYQVVQMPVKEG